MNYDLFKNANDLVVRCIEPNTIRLEVKFKKFTVIGFNYSAYSDFDSHDAELEFIGVTIFN